MAGDPGLEMQVKELGRVGVQVVMRDTFNEQPPTPLMRDQEVPWYPNLTNDLFLALSGGQAGTSSGNTGRIKLWLVRSRCEPGEKVRAGRGGVPMGRCAPCPPTHTMAWRAWARTGHFWVPVTH